MSASLPAQHNFEQLRKQAKTLLALHHSRNPECCRVLRHLHRFATIAEGDILSAKLTLADAQFAVALEHGFKTWSELKAHATRITPERAEALLAGGLIADVIGGAPATVRPMPKGNRTEPTLEVAGEHGTFIVRCMPPGEPPASMRREHRFGELFASLGVTAPRIQFVETHETTVAVYQKIEGEEFRYDMMKEEKARFVQDMAALLIRLHAVPLAEACRVLGVPVMTAEAAAKQVRFAGWFDPVAIEAALTADLAADVAVSVAWRETREWYEAFVSRPSEMVFGHGDLHSGNVLVARTDMGWRLVGVVDFQGCGILNLYDDFLRIIALDEEIGARIIAAYNAHPECRHPVNLATACQACRAFAFYLAHGQTGDDRRARFAWALELSVGGRL